MNILCSFCNIFFLHLKTQNPTTKTPIRSNIFVQIHFLDDFCSKCFLVATSKRTPTLEFISCTYRDSRVVRSAGSNNSCKTTLSLKYSVLRAITKFSTLNYNSLSISSLTSLATIFVKCQISVHFWSKSLLVATTKRTPTLELESCTYRDSRVVRLSRSIYLYFYILRAITNFWTCNTESTFNLISHFHWYTSWSKINLKHL